MRRFGAVRGLRNCARIRRTNDVARLELGDGGSVLARSGSSDWDTFSEVFLEQCYSDDFLELFDAVRDRSTVRTVVDAGANVGYSARFFADRYPNATVLALEPEASNFELLVANTSEISRIRPLRGALWNDHAELRIADESVGRNAIQMQVGVAESKDDAVTGFTLAELFDLVGSDEIDVLKIDIEGAERVVFESVGPELLRRVRLIMIELHDWKEPGASRAFYRALGDLDYDQFVLPGTVAIRVRAGDGAFPSAAAPSQPETS